MDENPLMNVIRKGVEMRRLQKAYFKSRDRGDLVASKQAEAEFDKLAKEALGDAENVVPLMTAGSAA